MSNEAPTPIVKGFMSDKVYQVVKWIAMIVLPAFGAFYFGLAGVWNLAFADEVVGTILVLDTFLGVVLGVSTANYNKTVVDSSGGGIGKDGDFLVDSTDPTDVKFLLQPNVDPGELANNKTISFRVVRSQ